MTFPLNTNQVNVGLMSLHSLTSPTQLSDVEVSFLSGNTNTTGQVVGGGEGKEKHIQIDFFFNMIINLSF